MILIENLTSVTLGVVGLCLLDPGANKVDVETFGKLKAFRMSSSEGEIPYLKTLIKEGKIALPERKAKPEGSSAEG